MGTPSTALVPDERVRTGVWKVGLWAIPLDPDITDFEPRVRKTHQPRARGRQLSPHHTPEFTNARLDLHVLAAHRRLEHKGIARQRLLPHQQAAAQCLQNEQHRERTVMLTGTPASTTTALRTGSQDFRNARLSSRVGAYILSHAL